MLSRARSTASTTCSPTCGSCSALLLAGGVALAGGLGWLVARRVVAPIAELTDAAEEISETQDLTRPIPVTGDDEVARLARRFSAMLAALERSQDALDDSVESQRRLVADASHELRTPVASIRTDIETLLGHPDLPAGERAEILAAADERIEELSELIGDIIELARGDTDDTAAAADDVRLDHVVEEAITRLGRHSPGRPVEADLAPAVVRARPDRALPGGQQPARQRRQVQLRGGADRGPGRRGRRRASPTTGPGSPRPTCRTCSIASGAARRRGTGPAPASAWRSSARSRPRAGER